MSLGITDNPVSRSVFIEYPDRAAAIDAIVRLNATVGIPFVVNNVTDFTADGGGISVYFVIDSAAFDDSSIEAEFIAAAVAAGGEYTGS